MNTILIIRSNFTKVELPFTREIQQQLNDMKQKIIYTGKVEYNILRECQLPRDEYLVKKILDGIGVKMGVFMNIGTEISNNEFDTFENEDKPVVNEGDLKLYIF